MLGNNRVAAYQVVSQVVLYRVSYILYTNVHIIYIWGARGSVVVKALCYKPEGRGFQTR
jgi:hypothetical protein